MTIRQKLTSMALCLALACAGCAASGQQAKNASDSANPQEGTSRVVKLRTSLEELRASPHAQSASVEIALAEELLKQATTMQTQDEDDIDKGALDLVMLAAESTIVQARTRFEMIEAQEELDGLQRENTSRAEKLDALRKKNAQPSGGQP